MNLIPQLEAYRPRAAVTDGTWIEPKLAPGVRFLVKEPSDSNLAFQYRLADLMEPDAPGEIISRSVRSRAARQAFIETCIVAVEGLDLSSLANGSGTPSLARIFESYPDLLTELLMTAAELGVKARAEAESALKNSEPPTPGP